MSSEWREVQIGTLIDEGIIISHKDGNHGAKYPRSHEFQETGVPFLTAKLMDDEGNIDINKAPCLDPKKAEEFTFGFVEEDDVLLSHNATVGRVAVMPKYDGEVLIGTSITHFRLDSTKIKPRYFAGYLNSSNFQNQLASVMSQTTRNQVPITTQRNLTVIIPPLDTQASIVDMIQPIDLKLLNNKKLNRSLENVAQAIFKSWFVDFDPVRAKIEATSAGRDLNRAAMAVIAGISLNQDWDEVESALDQKLARMSETQQQQLTRTAQLFPDELEESEIGEVPRGWGIKSLDKIADYLNGRAMQKYPPEEGKATLPVLKIAQLRKGDTEGADIATSDIPKRFKIRNGDMIFSWSGSLLIRLWAGGDAALNQHLFKVTSEVNDQWFYYHWTKHHLDNFIRIAESKAVTMGHIKRSHLKEAKCAIPDKEILEIGGQHIEPLLRQSVKLNLESNQLAEIRDTLLPKLISGEIEV